MKAKRENLDKAFLFLKRNKYFDNMDIQMEITAIKNVTIDRIQFYYQDKLVEDRVPNFRNGVVYMMTGDMLRTTPPRDAVDFSISLPKGMRAKILKKAKPRGMSVEQYIEMVCNDAVLAIGQMDNIDTDSCH